MAKTREPLKVPVITSRHGGGIYHDTDYGRGAADQADADRIDAECQGQSGHMRWGADYYMGEFRPELLELRLLRFDPKAKYAELVDVPTGRRFPMFLTDYAELMAQTNVSGGVVQVHAYEACKKGARYYGIRATDLLDK